MARPLIVRIFVDELPIKVLSMVLAVTLFVLVRNDKDATAGTYVKITYTLPADRVLVSDPPVEAKVSVRGPWTKLQHLDRAIEPIHVDLTRLKGPDLRLDEDLVKVPEGVRVSAISPSEIHVETEARVRRDVPVQPILEGEPAEGYRVSKVVVEPAHVTVDGAKSVVQAMERLPTRPLRVADSRGPLTAQVALEPPPAHAELVKQGTVTVRAEIEPAMVERTFDGLAVHVIGLNRLEGATEPAAARLILRGPSVLLNEVNPKLVTLQVDAALVDTRPPARYVRTVTVAGLPAGVAAEVQPDTTMLTTRRKRDQ